MNELITVDKNYVATLETKGAVEFGRAVKLHRLVFGNGYSTCWYSKLDTAFRAGATYLEREGVI